MKILFILIMVALMAFFAQLGNHPLIDMVCDSQLSKRPYAMVIHLIDEKYVKGCPGYTGEK